MTSSIDYPNLILESQATLQTIQAKLAEAINTEDWANTRIAAARMSEAISALDDIIYGVEIPREI